MLRLLKDPPKVEVSKPSPELKIIRVGISLWEPDESYLELPTPPSECAVCGSGEFEADTRCSALLMPRFDYRDLEYVFQVWVHRTCFEACIETNEPDPVPW
jgi:hypothetical protein